MNPLLRYQAAKVCDPMESAGASGYVVKDFNEHKKKGISYWGDDLLKGFHLTKQQFTGKFYFCWIHTL
jgi:hypothetical protein